jgi:hypothetical protein
MSNYYELIKKGLSSAANVTAAAVHKAAEVAKDLAEDLTSFKALKDYRLAGHIATAGPGNTWKIFLAVSKKPGRHPTPSCNVPVGLHKDHLCCGTLSYAYWWKKQS